MSEGRNTLLIEMRNKNIPVELNMETPLEV